ncbi:MAG: glycoside hydrolase family 130 protein, partial [Ignavibacteria bacterium]|nr:glycoside hydrolase family 130 protein [Ignavibacteria bacterium]
EAAALFNPSIVPHPDQTNLTPGSIRFILSLRATGEGHISSITFRVGTIDRSNHIEIEQPARYVSEPARISTSVYDKEMFERQLIELGSSPTEVRQVMKELSDRFTLAELRSVLDHILTRDPATGKDPDRGKSVSTMWRLAISNYEVLFRPDLGISERVLFPGSPSQSNGIEDARFVLFQDDDGSTMYYATYTAYDGYTIMPQLLETKDFLRFRFRTLSGPAVSNKGMALFPRKVNGQYAMLSRQDNQNILVMLSDNMTFWREPRVVLAPTEPWEFVQLGNCGSPIETSEGWLVLTHGVGPVRKYCIGAFLLDKKDPLKVLGRLREPLLHPTEKEREGYVPNVVYTCGAMIHRDTLVLPYAMSDSASSFATVSLDEVLGAMDSRGA